MEQEKRICLEVNTTEAQILQLLRSLEYGQITITVKQNKPVHIEEKKSILVKTSE